MSGTSMAAPHVAGVAAQILAQYGSYDGSEVKRLMVSEAAQGVVTVNEASTVNLRLLTKTDGFPEVPPAPATPAPTEPEFIAFKVVSGDCVVDPPTCISSPNFPSKYGNSESCTIQVKSSYFVGPQKLSVWAFNTEENFDIFTVNGQGYSGENGPDGVRPMTQITWASDGQIKKSGWKICTTGTPPTPAPTAAPTMGCADWCANENDKPAACLAEGWANPFACRGCSFCCNEWCYTETDPWEDRCTWGGCVGCAECVAQ